MSINQEQKNAQIGSLLEERKCPQCQAMIPVYVGYKPWCDKCDWNLEIPEPPPWQTLFSKLYRAMSQRSSQHLFKEMIKGRSLEAKFTPAKILAFLIAGCVHMVTFAFLVLGFWLCFFALPGYRFLGMILGLACILIACLLFLPGIPKVSKALPLPKEQFPTLYQVTEWIIQVLGSPPLDGIMYNSSFNAAFGQFGWRRKRLLILGLPLFMVLDGPEKIALLSHELAHGVNGDPNRNFFLGAALHSLATWYDVINPRRRWHIQAGLAAIMLLVVNLISVPIMAIIWLMGYVLSQLLWYDIQRAEYLADLLAARISGTGAHLAVLDKVKMGEAFRISLQAAYIGRQGHTFFAELKRRIARMPLREVKRLRRIEELANARIDVTHPPSVHRIEFLKANHVAEAKVVLAPHELAQLERELEPLVQDFQEQVFELDDISFRELFHLRW